MDIIAYCFGKGCPTESQKAYATILKGSLGHNEYSFVKRSEPTIPRPFRDGMRWRAIWVKEFLGYSRRR